MKIPGLNISARLLLLLPPAAAQQTPEPLRFGGFRAQIDALEQPAALAISPAGELWVVETWRRALSIHDSQGKLVQRLPLELEEPRGLALTPDGTLYLSGARRVVGLTWNAERKTLEALPTTMPSALVEPLGLCADGERLYVADAGLHKVLVFDRRSSKLLLAIGGFGGGEGQFRRPVDVAVDEQGAIHVVDQGNQRIERFDKDGKYLSAFGGFGWQPGLLAAPASIEYAAGRLYVADRDNHRIQVFDRSGKPLYDWGVHALRPREGAGHLHYPDAVAIAPDGSFAAVGEGFEDRVQLFGAEDDPSRLLRAQSERSSSAHYGGGLALGARLCVVLEPSAAGGLTLDTSGSEPIEIARFGRLGEKPGQFARPCGVALDAQERAWVCDPVLRRISIFRLDRPQNPSIDYDPFLPRFAESLDLGLLDGGEPVAVALDSSGRGYVLESRGEVLVLDPGFGSAHARPLPEGVAVSPCAIAVSADGSRIAVADPGAHALHLMVAAEHAWTSTVLAAEGGQARPSGVAFAADGSLFVTDERRCEVLQLSPALERVKSFGKPGLGRAEFHKPRGIAIDAQGRLWVLDLGNHRVQVLTPQGEFVQSFGSRLFTEPTRRKAGK